jgi:hypothetical protein
MRIFTPAEFVSRWPGSLHPVALPNPRPALPEDCQRLLAEVGLPRELKIYCYNDITLTFSGTATPLAVIWERDLERGYKLGEMPGEWSRFCHLADQKYLQGSGWICVEEVTGRLVVIDLDLPEPICLLNSGLRNFYTTLAHLLEWSERTGGSPAAVVRLRDALRQQDCIPPEELEPFWLNIIDATLDGDRINFVCALNLNNAEPPAAPDQNGQ